MGDFPGRPVICKLLVSQSQVPTHAERALPQSLKTESPPRHWKSGRENSCKCNQHSHIRATQASPGDFLELEVRGRTGSSLLASRRSRSRVWGLRSGWLSASSSTPILPTAARRTLTSHLMS